MQAERPCLDVALDVLADDVEDLLVGVQLIGTHVDDHPVLVGNHVVLSASVDDRRLHLRWSEERADALKTVVAQPHEVVEGFIDGIDAFVASGMT